MLVFVFVVFARRSRDVAFAFLEKFCLDLILELWYNCMCYGFYFVCFFCYCVFVCDE